jgi:hypothetical protein
MESTINNHRTTGRNLEKGGFLMADTKIIEHPILFQGDMVRAIIEGRKTQTRRIMEHQPPGEGYKLIRLMDSTAKDRGKQIGKLHWAKVDNLNIPDSDDCYFNCPFGQVGDRLWVRETWFCNHAFYSPGPAFYDMGPLKELKEALVYRADGKFKDHFPEDYLEGKWKPSIHMPRWASRINLIIDEIRAERLHDITEEDAIAEGVDCVSVKAVKRQAAWSRRQDFKNLWDKINGKKYSWDSNPWLWVIKFYKEPQ